MYAHIQNVAARQYGVFSRRQAMDAGFSEWAIVRLLRSGRWEAVLPGVYRIAGTPDSWEQQIMAACLWSEPWGVASHRSAARLWGLDGEWGGVVEVTVQYARSNERVEGPVVHRTRRLADRDRTILGGFPVTRVERTLVDLAGMLERNDLEVAMESAFRRSLTSMARLWDRTDALYGRQGLGEVRRLLEIRQPAAAHSRWETKLLQLIRDAGLPEPVRQYKIWDGERWRYIDLAYPDLMIGLEYDSYTWHSGRQPWERGHTRNADLTVIGMRMLPITMDDVAVTPERTAQRIGKLRETARGA